MQDRCVSVGQANGVSTILVSNPPVNAMSRHVVLELIESLLALAKDQSTRAIVISAAGTNSFMAGADIKEVMGWLTDGTVSERSTENRSAIIAVAEQAVPTIAAIEGYCFGGGLELALACDFRVAAKSAQFGLPEVKLGLLPGGGGTQRLARLVGSSKAKELMLLGDAIPAEEAFRIGLVNTVVPDREAVAQAQAVARRIASRPAVAVRNIKQAVEHGVDRPLREGLAKEAELFGQLFETDDAREGLSSFHLKRKPVFKHR